MERSAPLTMAMKSRLIINPTSGADAGAEYLPTLNEQLRENVITMRMLRGARVMPLVALGSKPMKTKFKMSERPDFQIVSWHLAGRGRGLA